MFDGYVACGSGPNYDCCCMMGQVLAQRCPDMGQASQSPPKIAAVALIAPAWIEKMARVGSDSEGEEGERLDGQAEEKQSVAHLHDMDFALQQLHWSRCMFVWLLESFVHPYCASGASDQRYHQQPVVDIERVGCHSL